MDKRQAYFETASSWALDSRERDARALRRAWLVAGVAAAIALLEAVAIAMLTPLKTVQPITLLVDKQTGFVQSLDPQTPRRIKADAALTQSLLAQYVTAREGFDRATVANDYRRVALWSSGAARSRYLVEMATGSAQNPFERYPAGTVVDTRVKSVSPLAPGTALIRFDTRRLDRSGREGLSDPWVSIVRYRFSDATMTFEDRLSNPLGFQVVGYRRDAEAPQPERSASTVSRPQLLYGAGTQPAYRYRSAGAGSNQPAIEQQARDVAGQVTPG